MTKKVLTIILIATCIMSLAACKNEPNPPIVSNVAQIASYNAYLYSFDSWKVEKEDNTREYYNVLLMFSEDYYGKPSAENLYYEKNGEYIPMTDETIGAEVTVYNVNQDSGICSFAKIKTNYMLDLKSVYALLEGPTKYQEGITTKKDYIDKNGTDEGWRAVMTSITTRIVPMDKVNSLQKDLSMGVTILYDDAKSKFYYEPDNSEAVNDGHSVMKKVFVDPMSKSGVEALVDMINTSGYAVNIVDGKAEKVELDEKIKIVAKEINGEFWVGFEAAEGVDINGFDLPDAVAYEYQKVSYFKIA